MKVYVVTSGRLSRKRGETFTDEELSSTRVDELVEGGHLAVQHRSTPKPTEADDTATEKEQ